MKMSGELMEDLDREVSTLKLFPRLAALVGTAILQSLNVPESMRIAKSFTSVDGDRYSFSITDRAREDIPGAWIRLQIQEGYVRAGFAHERLRGAQSDVAFATHVAKKLEALRADAERSWKQQYARVKETETPEFVWDEENEVRLAEAKAEQERLLKLVNRLSEDSVSQTRNYWVKLDGVSIEVENAPL